MIYGPWKETRNARWLRPASRTGFYHSRQRSAYSGAATEWSPISSTLGGYRTTNAVPDHLRPQEVQPHPYQGRLMQGLRMPRQASREDRQVRLPRHHPQSLMGRGRARRSPHRSRRHHPQQDSTEPRQSLLRRKTGCRTKPSPERLHQPRHRLRREEPRLLLLQVPDAEAHKSRTT
jgi:hypothetical protein